LPRLPGNYAPAPVHSFIHPTFRPPTRDRLREQVTVEGGNITVHVNGDLVNKGTNCSGKKGAICLQSERANVRFRNIRLRRLAP
jgi:hypothetical protein